MADYTTVAKVDLEDGNNEETRTATHCSFWKNHKKLVITCSVFVFVFVALSTGLGYYSYINKSTSKEKGDNVTAAHVRTEDICIYYTKEEILEKLREDPFGDYCKHDSKFVENLCYTPGKSSHSCRRCEDDSTKILPDFCFCDQKIHCDKTAQSQPYDHPRKTLCDTCHTSFNMSRYKDRGNCNCNGESIISCTCQEGFTNFMCSSIQKRICLQRNTSEKLLDCSQSNENRCVYKRSDGSELFCEMFTESNKHLRNKSLSSCDGNVTS